MSARDLLDAALGSLTREERIVAAAEKLVAAEAHWQRCEDEWDPLNMARSGIRSQNAEKARRVAFEVLKGEVNR